LHKPVHSRPERLGGQEKPTIVDIGGKTTKLRTKIATSAIFAQRREHDYSEQRQTIAVVITSKAV